MSSDNDALPVFPTKIELKATSGVLALTWQDGLVQELSAFQLRSACRCSSCSAQRLREQFTPPPDVRIEDVKPFGVAGLQLFFSDGHSRGVFPWKYLRELEAQDL